MIVSASFVLLFVYMLVASAVLITASGGRVRLSRGVFSSKKSLKYEDMALATVCSI